MKLRNAVLALGLCSIPAAALAIPPRTPLPPESRPASCWSSPGTSPTAPPRPSASSSTTSSSSARPGQAQASSSAGPPRSRVACLIPDRLGATPAEVSARRSANSEADTPVRSVRSQGSGRPPTGRRTPRSGVSARRGADVRQQGGGYPGRASLAGEQKRSSSHRFMLRERATEEARGGYRAGRGWCARPRAETGSLSRRAYSARGRQTARTGCY